MRRDILLVDWLMLFLILFMLSCVRSCNLACAFFYQPVIKIINKQLKRLFHFLLRVFHI